MSQNVRLFQPDEAASAPRKPRNPPKSLSVDQEQRVLQFARDQIERELVGRKCGPLPSKVYAARRDLFIFQFTLNTGLRSQELRDLLIPDIDLPSQQVTVEHGKGDKRRIVPIPDALVPVIAHWLGGRTIGYAIPGDDGGQLCQSTLYWRVWRLGRRAGIPFKVHPHTLRHTYAQRLYDVTRDIEVVRALLGHEFLSTTQVYAQASTVHLREAVNKKCTLPFSVD